MSTITMSAIDIPVLLAEDEKKVCFVSHLGIVSNIL
jgi:hypothetical protein